MVYEEVDFLIVTALREEADAVKNLLEEREEQTHDLIGRVSREASGDKYVVALIEIGAMGTNPAQAGTRHAIDRRNPKRVILTGIAAGFPEQNVALGDILVPYYIVPYELAKLRERSPRKWWNPVQVFKHWLGGERVEYEHRGKPLAVSNLLWNAANTLGRERSSGWAAAITTPRPDGTHNKPAVHSSNSSVLGSGDKVIGTEFAEARRWLLATYPREAIGLEMEAFGVLTACRTDDRPFLVVKASQDPATGAKDTVGEKDRWRAYAAEAAAAFSIALIRRFEPQHDGLVDQHMKEAVRVTRIFEADAPQPPFRFTVSRAQSYSLLRESVYDSPAGDITVLIPNDVHPAIALRSGGGTGKTTIIRSLFGPLIDAGLYPVLLDLRKYHSGRRQAHDQVDPAALIGEILVLTSAPRRRAHELERLAAVARLVVVIDGLNEVSRETRSTLLNYCKALHAQGTCYLLVTDRFAPPESLLGFSNATVDRLDPTQVKTLFDQAFGQGSLAQLDEHLRTIYTRPFFLSLALRTKRKFSGASVWSGIFDEFFLSQLRFSPAHLDTVAAATVKALDEEANFDLSIFRQHVDQELYASLLEAEVLAREGTGFEHHLWRDYLASRCLAKTRDQWRDKVFDAVTTFASSLECLSLTLEQLLNRALKDSFLQAVFDWNYFAAADCLADFRETDPGPRQVSLSIRAAVIGAMAEKRFDPVQRTRRRASEVLSNHGYEFARPFLESQTPEALREHIAALPETDGWFRQWQPIFTKPSGQPLTPDQLDAILSDNSLIGWAAANLARRSVLIEEQQSRLREIYRVSDRSEGSNSVRWRIVHVLGAHRANSNATLLVEALKDDPYHWVQYGAARALIEMAANSEASLRQFVLDRVREFISGPGPGRLWMRRQIWREILEAAFIRRPEPGWKAAAIPVLESIVEREPDQSHKAQLSERLLEFQNYDEQE